MSQPKIRFPGPDTFRKTLHERVEALLRDEGLTERDVPAMYRKTVLTVGWVAGLYGVLMWGGLPAWAEIIACLALGVGMAVFVFNIGHDANHGAYSDRPWVNTLLGHSYDLIGASSFLWRFRHNVVHHTYTNVVGVDFDISSHAPFMRVTNNDPWYWFHRYQHVYCWFLYTLLTANWLVSDITAMISGKYMHFDVPKARRVDRVVFVLSRLSIVAQFFVIPYLAGRSWPSILLGVTIVHLTMALILSVIFQLAHVVEAADMMYPASPDEKMGDTFAIHQLRTSTDFAPDNRLLSWMLGGLNFQAIHHLFPKICHIHYPKISRVVAEVAREHGVPYTVHPTFSGAIASHYRVMKRLAQRPTMEQVPLSVGA